MLIYTYLTCTYLCSKVYCLLIADNSNEVILIPTGRIGYEAPQSIKEVQVFVPNIYEKDSIVVSEDSKNLITIVPFE